MKTPARKTDRRPSAAALLLALAVLAPGAALAQDAAEQIDDLVDIAANLERQNDCEGATETYEKILALAGQLQDAREAARLRAFATTKKDKLADCYEKCKPTDDERALFEQAKQLRNELQTKRVIAITRRIVAGKNASCRFFGQVRVFLKESGGDDAAIDPCAIEDVRRQDMAAVNEQVDKIRGQLTGLRDLQAGKNFDKIDRLLNLYQQIDALRTNVYVFREEMVECDEVYNALKINTETLKDAYDEAYKIVVGAFRSRLKVLVGRIKNFEAEQKKTQQQLQEQKTAIDELQKRLEESAKFDEEVFGGLFDLMGMEVVQPREMVEGKEVDGDPLGSLATVLADERKTMEIVQDRYPEYFDDGVNVEALKRRRLILSKTKDLAQKFSDRGHGVVGYEKSVDELNATISAFDQIIGKSAEEAAAHAKMMRLALIAGIVLVLGGAVGLAVYLQKRRAAAAGGTPENPGA